MSYQVLARKWRPHNFTEVVGQEHVIKVLTNSIEHNRMHHAYLFTGTRGVGKTTIARIIAKALNCDSRDGFNPCGKCSICRDLDEGRFVDLIEVDAASRTKVEDTRELLENVQYAPSHGRYKVYLIDEVHMLSGHSFNALLKTLEEPPSHVKFLLATTDPQKIPVTVLSRCLQLNLKRLLPTQICSQMELILEQEGIKYDVNALTSLARAADGSMRDGLSLLDQAIVHSSGYIDESNVNAMLGTVARQPVTELLAELAAGDVKIVLEKINEIAELSPDFTDLLQQLLLMLHRIALLQAVPELAKDNDDTEMIPALAKRMSPEDVQLYYQIGLVGQRDLPLAPDPRSGFEMVLLRMLAFKPVPLAKQRSDEEIPAVDIDTASKSSIPIIKKGKDTSNIADIKENPASFNKANWFEIVKAIDVGGMARELANNTVLERLDDKQCILLLDPGHAQLKSELVQISLEKALQEYYQKPLQLVVRMQEIKQETPAVQLDRLRDQKQKQAELSIERDENVQALKETFDAQVIPGSVEPLN